MPPAISIVIPLYNKRDYIERCLRSVRAQTFTDYQIVVVNDGSTDGCEKLVEPFLRKGDPLIHQENGGHPAARNRALAAAEGDLIASLDADDEWLPGHLADIHELSQRFPEAGLFGTGIRTYRSCFVQDRYLAGGEARIVSYFRISVTAAACNSSSAAFRREIFEQLGGFLLNELVGADLEYWARIALHWPMALHPTVSSVVHGHASTGKARSATVNRCGPELAYGMLEQALKDGLVPTELETDVRAYVAAGRIRRAQFLIGKGLVRAAADVLNHESTLNAAVRGSLGPLRAYAKLARRLPDGSRAAVFLGRALLCCMTGPKALGVLGIPRKQGDIIFRRGFAGRLKQP